MFRHNWKYRFVLAAAAALCGCSPRPGGQPAVGPTPGEPLGAGVRTLAVGAFEADRLENARWSRFVANLLRDRLGQRAGRTRRYRLLPEEKAADADVIISGELAVRVRRSQAFGSRADVGPGAGPTPVRRFLCTVTITFTATRTDGRTVLVRRVARSFDSYDRPPDGTDDVIANLLRQCTERFVSGLFSS